MNVGDEQIRTFDDARAAWDAAWAGLRKNDPEGPSRFDAATSDYCEAMRPIVGDEVVVQWQKAFTEWSDAGARAELVGKSIIQKGDDFDEEELSVFSALKNELHFAFLRFDDTEKEVRRIVETRRAALHE